MKTSLKIFFSTLVALTLLAPTFVWASDATDAKDKAYVKARAAQYAAEDRARAQLKKAKAAADRRQYNAEEILQCSLNAQGNVMDCKAEYSCNDNDDADCDNAWYEKCLWSAALLFDWCSKWALDEKNSSYLSPYGFYFDLSDKCLISEILDTNKCFQDFGEGTADSAHCENGTYEDYKDCKNAN